MQVLKDSFRSIRPHFRLLRKLHAPIGQHLMRSLAVVGVKNAGLRLLGTAALIAVMIQGLLGGFRVKLNDLVGTDLAAVHGIFAQVVLRDRKSVV